MNESVMETNSFGERLKNGFATTAFVLSLIGALGAIFSIGLLFAIPAVILGHISLSKIKKAKGQLRGYGISVASLALGYISIAISTLFLAIVLFISFKTLPPRPIRQEVAALAQAEPQERQEAVLEKLSKGHQKEAEQLLTGLIRKYPEDQRLAFMQAVCSRSRWGKSRAERQFYRVEQMNPTTVFGSCARYTMAFDCRDNIYENLNGLFLLADQNPHDPMILWLTAIQCRDYFKLTNKTTYSKHAEKYYRRLLEIFEVGPVLLHQTFANVLAEELGSKEEALKHRYIAVELEPASWTYQGLANTLDGLKRYPEANETYAKLVEMDPHDADYWWGWANCLSHQNRYNESIKKHEKVLELDSGHYKANKQWGYCLEQLGRFPEALEKYKETISMNPIDSYSYDAAARVLTKMGRKEEGQFFLDQKKKIPTNQ